MPTASLLAWLFVRSTLLPHEPATLTIGPGGDLPSSDNVYGLIETSMAPLTSDRFDTGGLNVATPARISAYGSSWTHTRFRVGDLDVTSPLRPGMPFVLPDTAGMARADVTLGPMLAEASVTGPLVVLTPMRPEGTPAVSVQAMIAPSAWAPKVNGQPPQPIQRLRSAGDVSFVGSGPIAGDRLGGLVAVHWTHANEVHSFRTSDTISFESRPDDALTVLGHLVFAPRAHEEMRLLVLAQQASHLAERNPSSVSTAVQPALNDNGLLTDFTWQRADPARLGWRVSGGLQYASVAAASQAPLVFDSARSGSLGPVLFDSAGTATTVRASGELASGAGASKAHAWRAGASLEWSGMHPSMLTATSVTESVLGLPARVWQFSAESSAPTGGPVAIDPPPGSTARPAWREARFALYAADRIAIGGRAHVGGGVRFESLGASNGGTTKILWRNVYAQVLVEADLSRRAGLTAFAGVMRAGEELPPLALAYGDPLAPSGRVYLWTDPNHNGVAESSEIGTLVARVGPGAGTTGLSAIDRGLQRPYVDQGLFGARLDQGNWALSIAGVIRKEYRVIQPVNSGVPLSSYTLVGIADNGVSYPGPSNLILNGYSRSVASFGQDQYLLTNPAGLGATYMGLDVGAGFRSRRVQLVFSATASLAKATGANRGNTAVENDHAVLGDVLVDPNASVHARGRPFFDRGYMGKIAAVVQLPGDVHVGVVVRYQDGQPFARIAVVPGLNQGPEAVTAFDRGLTRFAFIGTIDLRVQKAFSAGRGRYAIVVDAFNLINETREVEENFLTGASFRVTSAIQPPRILRLGLQVKF